MVGPVCAKLALIFSGCITLDKAGKEETDAGEQMAVDLLTGEMELQEAEEEGLFIETEETEEAEEGGPEKEVSVAEHLQELEMGVENQELYDPYHFIQYRR